jgi:hypothetical protein
MHTRNQNIAILKFELNIHSYKKTKTTCTIKFKEKYHNKKVKFIVFVKIISLVQRFEVVENRQQSFGRSFFVTGNYSIQKVISSIF